MPQASRVVSFNTQCPSLFVPSPGKGGDVGTSGVACGTTLSNAARVGASFCAKGSPDIAAEKSIGRIAAFWKTPNLLSHILKYPNYRHRGLRAAGR
jgi:hypothetical protein